MPAMTVDTLSLSLDGHRLWLVSGTINPYRTLPAQWESRIDAAQRAGLNCIEVPVVWSAHEPRSGKIHFEGDLDISAFVRLIGSRRMHCIVRMGPYVGEGMDLGGLPSWLLASAKGKLRTGTPEFLHHCSRYLSALCEKLRDLQATHGRKGGGPIVAVQNEYHWFCGDQVAGNAYLGELNRFLRENGITVPILGAHNLYHSVEGEVDVWSSSQHLHANLRQLQVVRPDQPRIVVSMPVTETAIWGRPMPQPLSPRALMRNAAEVLAAGGQYNISPFCAGTNFGFMGGRVEAASCGFVATNPSPGALLGENGVPGPGYLALRRINTFASRFGRVLANFDPAYQPVIASLDGSTSSSVRSGIGISVLERRGSQGSIIFVFSAESEGTAPVKASILLPDGSTLPVDLNDQAVVWLLMNCHLAGRATLDYCNLCAFAVVGNVFLCYGPAGAPGVMSINGSAFEVIVPDGLKPSISVHEGVTVVVCNESVIDASLLTDDAVYLGATALDADGNPLALPDWKKVIRISATGVVTHPNATIPVKAKSPPSLGSWECAGMDDLVDGKSDRYALIDGPMPMQPLGAPHGYGWLRLKMKGTGSKAIKAGIFDAADRLHLYLDGEHLTILGAGPGAESNPFTLSMKGKDHALTMLVDNLGRASEGNMLDDPKGVWGHVYAVSPIKAPAMKLEVASPLEPLAWRTPIFGLEGGELTDPRRATWRLTHRKRTAIAVELGALEDPALLILNDTIVKLLPRHCPTSTILSIEQLARGTNVLQVAVVGDVESASKALKASIKLYECDSALSAKAAWSFAKWEPPAASRFKSPAKGLVAKGAPCWWRTRFALDAVEGALFLEANGLSKGQLYINGHNAGRYFVATRAGKAVPPQSRYLLPAPWLKTGANEIMLFDEHGFNPEKCRLSR